MVEAAGVEPAGGLIQMAESKVDAKNTPSTNTQLNSDGSVQCCPVLARVVSVWDRLSPAIRELIAALAEASTE